MSDLPLIAVTVGDVAGIGPEVTLKALADSRVLRLCRPVIVGDPAIMTRESLRLGQSVSIRCVEAPEAPARPDELTCWSPQRITSGHFGRVVTLPEDLVDVPYGVVDARAGQAAYLWLVAATQAALAGQVDAIVTAPLNKLALLAAGLQYPGHTEILAEECGVARFAMMLYVPHGGRICGPFGIGVAHVTLHTSIESVPRRLSAQSIHETILLIDRFLRRLGCHAPRIGVCALNPHGGEAGRFGDEESVVIAPGVAAANADGVAADGPVPADALMRRAVAGEFDGVVAMYHDQGHIAIKLVAFNEAVNVTLGLPITRTSPSHGTAFDIAGRGQADAGGMQAAIQTAVQLLESRERSE